MYLSLVFLFYIFFLIGIKYWTIIVCLFCFVLIKINCCFLFEAYLSKCLRFKVYIYKEHFILIELIINFIFACWNCVRVLERVLLIDNAVSNKCALHNFWAIFVLILLRASADSGLVTSSGAPTSSSSLSSSTMLVTSSSS